MRLIELLAVPCAIVPTLGLAAASHAADVRLTPQPGVSQRPPDVLIQPPAGQSGGGHLHVEALGCRILSDGDAWVDLGAGPLSGSHSLNGTCSVTVTPTNCKTRQPVHYVVEAQHLFYFSPQVGGSVPDAGIYLEALASSFGVDTHVTFDSASAYAAAPPPPPPPTKKGAPVAAYPIYPPTWLPFAAADFIAHAVSPIGPWKSEPGMPLFIGPGGNVDSWIELSMVNVFASKEVHNLSTFNDQSMCGVPKTYTATTALNVDVSLEAYDDLAADLSYFAAMDVAFTARAL